MAKDTQHFYNNISVKGIMANGEIGTAGQGLISNGTSTYWGTVQGPIGYTGSQGIQGTTGYTGSASTIQGPIGYTGSSGPIGYTGSASTVQGPIGYTGSQGTVGYTGSTGATWAVNNAWVNTPDGQNRFYFATSDRTYFKSGAGFEFRSAADANISVLANDGTFYNYASVRAPLFYDQNDTSYYIDPNVATILAGWAKINLANGGSSTEDGRGVVINGTYQDGRYSTRFRKWDDGGGIPLYIQQTNGTAGVWSNLASFGGSNSRYAFHVDGIIYTGYDVRSPIYYDSNDTSYYVNPNGSSRFYGDLEIVAGEINLTGAGTKYIDANGAIFIRYSDNGTFFTDRLIIDTNGSVTSFGDFRAPIFYDTNNTGYFIDPSNTSNIYRFQGSWATTNQNTNWYTAFQNTPTASRTFHGDISSGGPSGTWWFYESMRHSNVANYWGTQVAWGWEDNANRLLQRNITGGTVGSWVEYLNTSNRTYNGNLNMTGSIISTASDVRAPIFYDQNNTSYYIDPGAAGISVNILGELWTYGDNKRIAWSVDSSTDSIPNVSIRGTTSASGDLVVQNWSGSASNDNFWIFGASRDAACAGNITAYYSDERLKTKTGSLNNALEKIKSLEGFIYRENELARSIGYRNDRQQVGLSAQQVQAVLPEAVALAPFDYDLQEDGSIVSKSGENYLTVDYSRLVPLLVEAIKEQQSHINSLQCQINQIKGN